MKNIVYIFLCMTLLQISSKQVAGQGIFNDTILNFSQWNDTMMFSIRGIRQQGQRFKYLIEFESRESSTSLNLDGIGVLSMCGCYCDSIWDAWPVEVAPSGQGMALMYYSSGGNNDQDPQVPPQGILRGRMGILQMPGSFERETEFMLPVSFRLND